VAQVPVVGALLSAAVDKGVDFAKGKWSEKKKAKYQLNPQEVAASTEALRKSAKVSAKPFKALAEKIDGNMVKLKGARNKFTAAERKFFTAPKTATMWELSITLYERRRYEQKLLGLSKSMELATQQVNNYLSTSLEESGQLESDIETIFEDLEDQLVHPKAHKKRRDGFIPLL